MIDLWSFLIGSVLIYVFYSLVFYKIFMKFIDKTSVFVVFILSNIVGGGTFLGVTRGKYPIISVTPDEENIVVLFSFVMIFLFTRLGCIGHKAYHGDYHPSGKLHLEIKEIPKINP